MIELTGTIRLRLSVRRSERGPARWNRESRQRARDIFSLFMGRGYFMAVDAPIRFKVDEIVEFLTATGKKGTVQSVRKAVDANAGVFMIVEDDGVVDCGHTLRKTTGGAYKRPDAQFL